uniref:Uncharacterized protein n=1 Tax=Trieres chinensis TaxID=1514140 RepID=A0A7S2ECH0_TRICV|eukprot:CAMPEP_0183307562 /NCGR_PEP_ID=MMETSP0160_2-20130417/18021_1 /TAXON_ID=2839 ORGANISM="Odontella Sinensis, Strain Grunow 1884" /NCGR_SAMPLE_ID=MMETSP0160_2 /ASSEMBLY_ACC=CAM_ASM_000250 /LENGTH=117 /DNA_ID=CAMNT_0025471171 /DNA_START=31 /DNA_END=384 /DNA_ORIENTATION=-
MANEPSKSTPKADPPSSPLSWIITPSPDINYDFISAMYAGGSGLCLFFYSLHRLLEGYYGRKEDSNINEEETGSIAEFARSLEGIWLVFAPFFPCLLWSLVVRSEWKRKESKKEKQA